jgi:folylpolyglutamate synthase
VNALNVIHVAGTKGKGSTCVFAESFLSVHGTATEYPRKIGLYTSPHIKTVRERIRINCTPISEDLFTTYFFEVWDKLPARATEALDVPRYLQLLALLSFHVFIKENVDVAIYETHSGGEYDATNIIERPVVTGITTIGMDHAEILGPSIGDISWHKAGIFKSGRPAFSAPQEPAAAVELRRRADEKGVPLHFVDIDRRLCSAAPALKPEVQQINCSLALALVGSFLSEKAPPKHSSLVLRERGIERFSWPGRFQRVVEKDNSQWFLDGAHNESSMHSAVGWFANTISENQR